MDGFDITYKYECYRGNLKKSPWKG